MPNVRPGTKIRLLDTWPDYVDPANDEEAHDQSAAAVPSRPRQSPSSDSELHSISNDLRGEHPIGPDMRALRRAQADRGRLEYYTVEHLRRLKQFTAATPYKGGKSNVYCKDVHVQPCKECQSCHFCRQKTIDPKTSCRCQFLPVRGLPGGKARGAWCGQCLWVRMGENINEVASLYKKDWRCPCCRDICNCSGANCLRSRRNLEPTKMLISEAEKLNYKSVAHYLILTHLSSEGAAMPMEELSELRHRKRQAEQARLLEEPPHKAAKLSKADRASAAVRQKGERRIEEQMEKLFKVCSSALTQRRPPLSESGFGWGILDRDRDDEDEDDDGPGASNPFSRTHTATGVPANPPNASNQLPGGESAGGASVAGAVPQNPFLHRVTAPREPSRADAQPQYLQMANDTGAAASPACSGVGAVGSATGMVAPAGHAEVQSRQHPAGAAGTAAARGRPRASGLPDAEEWHDTRFDGPHPGLDAGTCAPVRSRWGQLRAARPREGEPRLLSRAARQLELHSAAGRAAAGDGSGAAGRAMRPLSASAPYHPRNPTRHMNQLVTQGAPLGQAALDGVADRGRYAQQAQQQRPLEGALHAERGQHAQRPASAAAAAQHHRGDLALDHEIHDLTGDNPVQPSRHDREAQPIQAQSQPPDMANGSGQATDGPASPTAGADRPADHQQGLAAAAPGAAAMAAAHAEHAGLGPALPGAPHLGRPDSHLSRQGLKQSPAARKSKGWYAKLHEKADHLSRRIWAHAAFTPEWEAEYQLCEEELRFCLADLRSRLRESVMLSDTASHEQQQPAVLSACQLRTVDDLRHATECLLMLASVLPKDEVEYDICHRLFNKEPFVDFESSCIEARGTLVYAAFELLQVMSRRGMDLSPAVEGILGFLAVVAAEFERLSRPIDASAGRIGPEQLMGVAEEDEISLAALRHCDSYQLLVILQLIQRVCHTPTRGAERLLGEELMCLLDVGTLFTRDHRQEALAAIYTAVLAVSPDALERMSEDEVLEAVEHRRALAEQIRTAVLPRLEACVVMTYPDRALAEGLLDRGSPLDLALEVRERYQQTQDPGSVLAEVLAEGHGLCVQVKLKGMDWDSLSKAAMQPYAQPGSFWRQPQSLYRHFGVFYVARALTAAPDVTCQTRVAVELLHMWLRALLDTGSRTVLAFFTDVLSKCSGGQVSRLFQGARSSFDGICGDRSGAVRAELAATVFGALARSEDHEYLKFIMEDLDGMLAERTFSLESRGANCAFRWHAPTARILMAVAGAATDWLAKMVVKDKGPSLGVMLRQVARWMDKAAVYLQSCYAEVLRESADSAGPAEDAAPAATLGDARQVVGQSALLCMPSMLATTAQAMRIAHQAALQIARTSQSPPPTFHKAMEANGDLVYTVRLALAPCLEVPLGGVEPSPVDRACWELLATALVPSPGTALPGGGPGGAGQASADLANAGQANAAQADAGQSPAMQELILEVLGTHVRWHLSRALVGDTGTRNAVNTLRWMAVLFSQPRLRGHEAMLKLLLPQLLSPLLQILAPGSPDSGAWAPTYRMGVRHAAYSFLTELLEVHPAVLPPRVDLDKLPRVEDSPINGALQSRNQAAALKDIRWDNARQHVFHAVAGGIVAVVASLVIDPREDMPCVAGMQPLDEKATNSALGQLTKCFGMPRSFDALTRQSAAPLPFKLAPGQQPFRPPDFKYVVAAQCFKFVGALAKVERHGKTWVGPIMASLQQLMRHNAALAKPLKPAYSQLVALLKGLGLMVQAPPAAAPAHVQTLMVQAPPAAAAPRERLWSREELAHCKRGDVVTVRGWLSQAPTEEQHNHICWLKANVDDAEGRLARIMAVKELQFVDRLMEQSWNASKPAVIILRRMTVIDGPIAQRPEVVLRATSDSSLAASSHPPAAAARQEQRQQQQPSSQRAAAGAAAAQQALLPQRGTQQGPQRHGQQPRANVTAGAETGEAYQPQSGDSELDVHVKAEGLQLAALNPSGVLQPARMSEALLGPRDVEGNLPADHRQHMDSWVTDTLELPAAAGQCPPLTPSLALASQATVAYGAATQPTQVQGATQPTQVQALLGIAGAAATASQPADAGAAAASGSGGGAADQPAGDGSAAGPAIPIRAASAPVWAANRGTGTQTPALPRSTAGAACAVAAGRPAAAHGAAAHAAGGDCLKILAQHGSAADAAHIARSVAAQRPSAAAAPASPMAADRLAKPTAEAAGSAKAVPWTSGSRPANLDPIFAAAAEQLRGLARPGGRAADPPAGLYTAAAGAGNVENHARAANAVPPGGLPSRAAQAAAHKRPGGTGNQGAQQGMPAHKGVAGASKLPSQTPSTQQAGKHARMHAGATSKQSSQAASAQQAGMHHSDDDLLVQRLLGTLASMGVKDGAAHEPIVRRCVSTLRSSDAWRRTGHPFEHAVLDTVFAHISKLQ